MRGALALVCFFLAACQGAGEPEGLEARSFADLPGWREDKVSEALPALKKSCGKDAPRKSEACRALIGLKEGDEKGVREALEKQFTPYEIIGDGLFTGYYEATLQGSLKKEGPFRTPLWGRPKDLVEVDLGAFDKNKTNQKLFGKIEKGKLVPYDTREEIAAGSLKGRATPVAWVASPMEAFFLETQGSGRILLPDGRAIHVGYGGRNGHPYRHIGAFLLRTGELERPVTMGAMIEWLEKYPSRQQETMNLNPSVVFFKIRPEGELVGAQGVALTPGRSLAVDPAFIPFGAPVWIAGEKHRRLAVAQDAGGAIKGPLRGDLFWGAGGQAEEKAGAMQERGTWYVFLPKGRP